MASKTKVKQSFFLDILKRQSLISQSLILTSRSANIMCLSWSSRNIFYFHRLMLKLLLYPTSLRMPLYGDLGGQKSSFKNFLKYPITLRQYSTFSSLSIEVNALTNSSEIYFLRFLLLIFCLSLALKSQRMEYSQKSRMALRPGLRVVRRDRNYYYCRQFWKRLS